MLCVIDRLRWECVLGWGLGKTKSRETMIFQLQRTSCFYRPIREWISPTLYPDEDCCWFIFQFLGFPFLSFQIWQLTLPCKRPGYANIKDILLPMRWFYVFYNAEMIQWKSKIAIHVVPNAEVGVARMLPNTAKDCLRDDELFLRIVYQSMCIVARNRNVLISVFLHLVELPS